MESMHLTARLVIEQNMQNMTAFSARPNSPVQPVDDHRSVVSRLAASRRRHRNIPLRRARLRHAAA